MSEADPRPRRPRRQGGRGRGRPRVPRTAPRRRLSPERVAARAASVPRISYPPELPVSDRRDDIAAAIRDHQVVVIAGETGSGKTTQIPKICLELGLGATGLVGHTQPRRIAARSVSERIAFELGVEHGGLVGYQVRFTDHSTKDSLIKVMTDGILLAELQHDRLLSAYSVIIIDEAHERSLNIDFILGYLKQLLTRRPDLKVVITSATIDPGRFSDHFGGAPVIEVSGRTYPVEVRYRPLVEESYDDEEGEPVVRDQTEAVVAAVQELIAEGPGDILVFLPGEREIRDTADVLGKGQDPSSPRGFDVVPLYARLTADEQHRVFRAHTRRRVVLATNVAETSLTVPGIRYVVDAGVARISRYSYRTKVQRLPIEPVSQASANQRAGRCGRVEAGVCIRLYSEEDFLGRPEFTDPEILRTNLASVILQMTGLGLGDVARFPFVDPPDGRNVAAGLQLLEELGALQPAARTSARGGSDQREGRLAPTGGAGRLTKVGRQLVALPIDPRLARMVVEADRLGCLREVLVIAAALSSQDPRERPADKQTHADQQHARFRHESSDFLTLLNLWRYVRTQQRELSSSAFRRMCRGEYLNYLRIREWQELEAQLRRTAKDLGFTVSPAAPPDAAVDEDGIHQALLAGLLSHIGLRDPDRRDYLGARNARFSIFPGSGLFKKQPQLVMAAELVETSRLYARVNAAIKPEWAEALGAHLVRRSYSEPHWSKKRAAVLAYERVTLYGVPLAADRLVSYGSVDPALARELFIRHALVYGEWQTRHRFFHENQRLLADAEELEHRARRRGIVVDEHTLFDFYDARVGPQVVSGAHFDSWWKRAREQTPDLLTFDPEMLVRDAAGSVRQEDYPDEWREGPLTMPLAYHFAPGAADDGVTVEVPLAVLNQVDAGDFSWQVPGLREHLVVALLRSLPKSLRVSFVPAPNHARAFLAAVAPGEEPLLDALERHLRATTGIVVPRDAWDWAKVPDHLRPTFKVVAEDGSVVTTGKDLEALRAPLEGEFAAAMTQAADDSGLTTTGQTTWTFGTIPASFEQDRAGHRVRGYPALVDEGTTVGLTVLGTAGEQESAHRLGLRRLLLLGLPTPPATVAARLLAGLGNAEKLGLAGSPYPSAAALLEDCVTAAVEGLMDRLGPEGGVVWDEESFTRLLAQVSGAVEETARSALALVLVVLERWRATDRLLTGAVDLPLLAAVADLRAQLGRLVYRGFVADVGLVALGRLPRYLDAAAIRREQIPVGLARDRELMDRVAPLQEAYLNRLGALVEGRPPPRGLVRVRWMLEEYRLSLWAQQLGTAYPVSDTRIRRALAEL